MARRTSSTATPTDSTETPKTTKPAVAKAKAAEAPETAAKVYQLKVSLAGPRTSIWRRVLVPAHSTLGELHEVIQALMGWQESHLHDFVTPGVGETTLKTRRARQKAIRYSPSTEPAGWFFDDEPEEESEPEKEAETGDQEPFDMKAALTQIADAMGLSQIIGKNDLARMIDEVADAEDDGERDEDEAFLDEVAPAPKYHFLYTYDMGDNWEHDIVVEKILPADPEGEYPVCLTGERNGPIEDSGGMWGYESLLETLANPAHEDHKETKSWLRDAFGLRKWEGETFDLEGINKRLARLRPKKKRTAHRASKAK